MRREHVESLIASGLDRGWVSAREADGWLESTEEGLKFYYFDDAGRPNGFYRLRRDQGKPKYLQPPESGVRLYRPPGPTRDGAPVMITEGEKKALALHVRLGDRAVVVGLGGCWNWLSRSGTTKELMSELASLVAHRRCYVIFDSDAAANPEVRLAEHRLTQNLRRCGATARIVQLPPDHKGIDDWLVAWGVEWESRLTRACLLAVEARTGAEPMDAYDRVYTFGEMLNQEFSLPTFYWGDEAFGLVGQGLLSIIHGLANVGKTYFATALGASIVAGREFLGLPVRPATVLYMQGELPPGLFARGRLDRMEGILGAASSNFLVYNNSFNLAASSRFGETFNAGAFDGFAKLDGVLADRNPDVLILDPLQSYHNLVEASNDQNRELMKRFKQIAINRNMAVILIDHNRKAPGEGPMVLRGASSKVDLADTVLGLAREGGRIQLRFDKIRYIDREKPEPWSVQMDDGMFTR